MSSSSNPATHLLVFLSISQEVLEEAELCHGAASSFWEQLSGKAGTTQSGDPSRKWGIEGETKRGLSEAFGEPQKVEDWAATRFVFLLKIHTSTDWRRETILADQLGETPLPRRGKQEAQLKIYNNKRSMTCLQMQNTVGIVLFIEL
ncbi:uncharacterized protein LOC144583348 [Pogona vitticeps]